jgi:GNAT superfamily N-acetyltransferase
LTLPTCRAATPRDARAGHAIRAAAAADLVARFGDGHWGTVLSLDATRDRAKLGELYLIEDSGAPVATFILNRRQPGWYHAAWFADPQARSGYLTHLAVRPESQRQGVGRHALAAAEALCRKAGLGALRFDAYQGPAGAGPFYVKCGYTLRFSNEFRGVGLDYYEKVLAP